jgi:thioredoxin reductase
MPRSEPPRVAVLGAGPVGLEAALYARRLNLPVTVYERSQPGEHVRRWGHVRLFTPFGYNSTPLGRAAVREHAPDADLPGDNDILTGHAYHAAYLKPLAESAALRGAIQAGTQVVQVGRAGYLKRELPGDARRGQLPFRLLLRDAQGKERTAEADVVLDCTGTYGQPCRLGADGIAAVGETALAGRIAHGLEDIRGGRKAHYAGKTTLVVGAGYSAATTVSLLADLAPDHPETWVVWLARGPRIQPILRLMLDPLKERDRLALRANALATRGDGNLEFHPSATVESLALDGKPPDAPIVVTARVAGKERQWTVDRIIANTGFTPDTELNRELQIHECYASLGPMGVAAALLKQAGAGAADCLSITATGPATLRTPEPNFFILGAKSYGRNPNFLMRTGFDQVRDVFTLITGKPNLDLYGRG